MGYLKKLELRSVLLATLLTVTGHGFNAHAATHVASRTQAKKTSSGPIRNRATTKVTAPKVSGLYVAHFATGVHCDRSGLRFYPDGVVIYTESGEPVRKWMKELDKSDAETSGYVYQGRYSIDGKKIQFTVESTDFGPMTFEGTIEKSELRLKVSGYHYATKDKLSDYYIGKTIVFKPMR